MRLKDAHLLERRRDRRLQLHLLALVRLPGREQHYEEREQQRDEVRIRNQPALVPRAALMLSPVAPAVSHRASTVSTAFFASKRKVRSLISIVRGFIPSWIDVTPSSIISRSVCSSCCRMRSLPAIGRNTRFASPTPYMVATNATAIPRPTSLMSSRCCIT